MSRNQLEGEREVKAGRKEAGRFSSPWIELMQYYLKRSGVNQSEAADACGVTRTTFSHYMTGRNNPPIGESLDRIIRQLGLSDQEADMLRDEADLANTPERIRRLVRSLREENKALRLKQIRRTETEA